MACSDSGQAAATPARSSGKNRAVKMDSLKPGSGGDMGATAYPSPTATADNIKAGLRAREQAIQRGPNASPSHVPRHSGISIRFNSPTVAGAALAFIPIKRDSTSFPFNLTRTNDGQAPRHRTIMNRHPFFSTLPWGGGFSLLWGAPRPPWQSLVAPI